MNTEFEFNEFKPRLKFFQFGLWPNKKFEEE